MIAINTPAEPKSFALPSNSWCSKDILSAKASIAEFTISEKSKNKREQVSITHSLNVDAITKLKGNNIEQSSNS